MTRSINKEQRSLYRRQHLSSLSLKKKQRPEGVGLLHIKTPERELRHLFKHKDNVGTKPTGEKNWPQIKIIKELHSRALGLRNGLAGDAGGCPRTEGTEDHARTEGLGWTRVCLTLCNTGTNRPPQVSERGS